jgi:transposase
MIRIHLSEAEAQRLEQAFRSATDAKLRDRLNAVHLAHRGLPRQAIADQLGLSTRSVQRWLNAYLERGPDGLAPRKPPGARPKIPAKLGHELRRWVIEGPAKQGLDRANWTHPELAEHLYRTHGIRTSRSAVQRLCAKLGIRPYRPTYRYLRGDPAKQRQAQEDLAGLKKKRPTARSSWLSRTRRASRWCRRWRPPWGLRGTGRRRRRATTRGCCTCSRCCA